MIGTINWKKIEVWSSEWDDEKEIGKIGLVFHIQLNQEGVNLMHLSRTLYNISDGRKDFERDITERLLPVINRIISNKLSISKSLYDIVGPQISSDSPPTQFSCIIKTTSRGTWVKMIQYFPVF